MAYFEFSTDNTTWVTNLPQPASLSYDAEDLDSDSYRSVANGNIVRKVVSYKWQKISFGYNYLTEAQAKTLIATLRTANNIYIRTKSALLSNNDGYVTLRGYISKLHFEFVKTSSGDGYTVSFNFVEGKR